MHVVQTPFDEMLAIVGEQPVTFFAESRARPADRLGGGNAGLTVLDDEYRPPAGELRERHFFDRLAQDVVHQRAVVHDPPLARIQAVMREAEPWSDEMRAGRG